MAIKISPSNIFDINHSPIPLNTYENVSLKEQNYTIKVGDVTNPISLVFYEMDAQGNITDVANTANKEIVFTTNEFTENSVIINSLRADITVQVVQKTHLWVDANNDIISHSFRRETTYYDTATKQTYTEVSFEKPFLNTTIVTDEQITFKYFVRVKRKSSDTTTYIIREIISFEGQYYEKADDTTAVYDDSITAAKNILKLPTNELVQGDNTYGYKADAVNAVNYSDKLIAEVFDRYKNGKETATLLCSVGKYYDLDGNLVVDAENEDSSIAPLLKKYDIVVPYVMTSRGEAPLSTDASGNPKQFQIIGVNISYNGIPRQEIVIQEYAT
jgi:hypothetical protein